MGSRYWTSHRTGLTYDTTVTDAAGRWAVVPEGGSLSFLGGALAALGIGAVVAGVTAVITVTVVIFAAVMIPLVLMRWPLMPLILLATSLALLLLPEGRKARRWILLAAVLSLVMFPWTIFSGWFLSRSGPTLYAAVAGFPLLPLLCLAFAMWMAVKKSWPVALALGTVATVTGGYWLIGLLTWSTRAPRDPAGVAGTTGLDNLLSTTGLIVIVIVVAVIARQFLASRTPVRGGGAAGAGGPSGGPPGYPVHPTH